MEKIKQVAALIEKNNRILITQRSYGDLKGKWEFPSETVAKGEKERDAIYRGILDEYNISIKCDDLVYSKKISYSDKKVELKLYHCTYLSGEMVLNTHSSYVFVDKNLLLSYDLIPDDVDLAKYIVTN